MYFSDRSTIVSDTWLWDFGDGGTSKLQNPQYTYTKVGTYTITLLIENICGWDTITKTNYIYVN